MRLLPVTCLAALGAAMFVGTGTPLVAQLTQGSSPAAMPEDLWDYGCTRWDENVCDQAPSPPLNDPPYVGTWVRISLLRNSFSVQPPDAPLYLFMGSDGYWSMMEFPANRPKVNKPLEQQTPAELFTRFDKMAGAYGYWTVNGTVTNRHHMGGMAPGAEGGNEHIREAIFEGSVMALVGTGDTRSPQARMRRLPVQPLSSQALVGTWERTALTVNGQAVTGPTLPQWILLGEDGWFHQTVMPKGRTNPGKPRGEYTSQDYVAAYGGLSAARGTYDIFNNTLVRVHAANIDPNLTGWREVAEFTLNGGTLTLQGEDESGARIQATYAKLPPRDVRAQP